MQRRDLRADAGLTLPMPVVEPASLQAPIVLPDGGFLIATDEGDLGVWDGATAKRISPLVHVGRQPINVDVHPDQSRAWTRVDREWTRLELDPEHWHAVPANSPAAP